MSLPPLSPLTSISWTTLTGAKATAGSIARWLNKGTLSSGTNGDADLILQEAQGWIYTRLRHWKMLTAPVSATMVVGADQISVPADALELDFLMIVGMVANNFYQQALVQKQANDIYMSWGFDGQGNRLLQQPTRYSFNQSMIQLDNPPDLAYPYVYTYYQYLAPLSSSNPTNFLTNFYPRLVRCACMMMGAEWTKESNQGQYDRTYWEAEALKELMEAQAQSDRARRASVDAPSFPGGTPGYLYYGGEAGW